jgi:hypothetical protein
MLPQRGKEGIWGVSIYEQIRLGVKRCSFLSKKKKKKKCSLKRICHPITKVTLKVFCFNLSTVKNVPKTNNVYLPRHPKSTWNPIFRFYPLMFLRCLGNFSWSGKGITRFATRLCKTTRVGPQAQSFYFQQ